MRLNSLTANFSTFQSIIFRDGLNIIVADRAKEATKLILGMGLVRRQQSLLLTSAWARI